MINFYILTCDLLYRRQIEKLIDSVIDSDSYILRSKLAILKSSENNIYIIDLEYVKNLEELYDIRSKDKLGTIVLITSHKTNLDVYSYSLNDYILVDKEENYIKKLENIIVDIVENSKLKSIEINDNNKHLKIYLDEIISIETEDSKAIIKGIKKNGKEYTYIMLFEINNVKNLKEFILNFKSNLTKLYYSNNSIIVYNQKNTHKVYSNSLKNKIILLNSKGISVKYLSKKYNINPSTIYSWVRKNKLENKILELETNNIKYQKIEKIVKSE